MPEVKQKYALTPQGDLISIDVLFNRGDAFFCPGCGQSLIARMGAINQWHFSHRAEADCECSSESYLHKTAKLTLYKNLENRLNKKEPFYLKYRQIQLCDDCQRIEEEGCFFQEIEDKRNILARYTSVKLETPVGDYRPDILLEGNDDRLFLEIVITHPSDYLKMGSPNKIVEISISSEADIEALKGDVIDLEKEGVRGNLSIRPLRISKLGTSECRFRVRKFVIFGSGKARLLDMTESEYDKLLSKIIYQEDYHPKENPAVCFVRGILTAHAAGIGISNCHLCRYHGFANENGDESKTIFCKYLRKTGNSNMATQCEYFKIDVKAFTCIVAYGNRLRLDLPKRNWRAIKEDPWRKLIGK